MTIVSPDSVLLRDLGEHGTLTFRETPRRAYHLERPGQPKAQRLTSVTTILQVLAKGRGFEIWQHDQGAAGALAAVRMGELDPAIHHDSEAGGVVRALGLGADAKRDAAATVGLSLHDALAEWAGGGDLPNPADMDPTQRPYLQGLSRLLLALDPEPTDVEQVTCHPDLGYAGRFDLRARVDGQDVLLDLKVRERPATRETDCLQLVGYAHAEEALGAPWPNRLVAVAIGPDGSFVTHDVNLPHDAFARVLSVYRLVADVRRPIEQARRAAKKAQEAAA